ncbi:hypothetical protein EOL70_14640 [Leucothrix sargassi]|nr:hypothetical protein EOL70_14640 [Leucothrix sargassi]
MHKQNNKLKMSGLSLIELLVSMVIGLFLIGGLVNVYISTKGTDSVRNEVSLMEENARIALAAIRQIVSHAGYPSVRNLHLDSPFYADAGDIENPTCRGGTETVIRASSSGIMKNKTGTIGTTTKRDTLVTVSIADSPNLGFTGLLTSDCLQGEMPLECSSDGTDGIYNPSDAKIYNYLHIDTTSGKRALRCRGSRAGYAQPIAENIENMQFMFGVIDDNGNYQYRNAEDISAASQWGLVVSVQAAILVRSEKEVLETAEVKNFILLDEEITTAKDRRLYRVYTTSIVLPNRAIREL